MAISIYKCNEKSYGPIVPLCTLVAAGEVMKEVRVKATDQPTGKL
jgi:hypothetical protein